MAGMAKRPHGNEAGKYVDMPKQVQVGTVLYDVICDDETWVRHEHANQMKGHYGYTAYRSAQILLNPDMTDDQTRLTLWHEVMHALNESVMGNPDWTELGEEPSETVVRRLEHPTLAVLRDNPKLVKYLMADNN